MKEVNNDRPGNIPIDPEFAGQTGYMALRLGNLGNSPRIPVEISARINAIKEELSRITAAIRKAYRLYSEPSFAQEDYANGPAFQRWSDIDRFFRSSSVELQGFIDTLRVEGKYILCLTTGDFEVPSRHVEGVTMQVSDALGVKLPKTEYFLRDEVRMLSPGTSLEFDYIGDHSVYYMEGAMPVPKEHFSSRQIQVGSLEHGVIPAFLLGAIHEHGGYISVKDLSADEEVCSTKEALESPQTDSANS
jgi:hypothetical protein